MKKNKTLSYSDYVKLGKDLVQSIEAYQVKIAEYATKVCDIRHGGISTNYYTITDYAKDIGIPYKTLQNWVRVYRNVCVKVDKKIETKKDWEMARKTNDVLTMDITVENKKENTPKKIRLRDIPKNKVQKTFDTLCEDEKPFLMEFNRILKSTKYTHGLIKVRDLNLISEDSLIHLMELLDNTSDLINNYLTDKKKNELKYVG